MAIPREDSNFKYNMKKLTEEKKNYIAGFLDSNCSMCAQIVRGKQYKYSFRIRVFIGIYKKKEKHWFMLKLKKLLGYGLLRIRKDGISELIISGAGPVEQVLLHLKDFLILKKGNANLILEIIERKKKINSKDDFIEICKLVDQLAKLNCSKKRLITSEAVKKFLKE